MLLPFPVGRLNGRAKAVERAKATSRDTALEFAILQEIQAGIIKITSTANTASHREHREPL